MSVRNPEYGDLHDAMKALCERKDQEGIRPFGGSGWANEDEKRWSEMVVLCLWALSQNRSPAPTMMAALHEYMAELEKARR